MCDLDKDVVGCNSDGSNGLFQPEFSTFIAPEDERIQTAIIYCEGHFGDDICHLANGLVVASAHFQVLVVIDSTKAGQDSGVVLFGTANGIPICRDLTTALLFLDNIPDFLVFGWYASDQTISLQERRVILTAIEHGIHVIHGSHDTLNQDPIIVAACKKHDVQIRDWSFLHSRESFHRFTNQIKDVTTPRIVIMGDDTTISRLSTTNTLAKTLTDYGLNVVKIATSQVGLAHGSFYGVALEFVPPKYYAGELENVILEAYVAECPDLFIVEGHGMFRAPSFYTSAAIICGANPEAIILNHTPELMPRCGFSPVPDLGLYDEIQLIEMYSKSRVILVTLNTQGLSTGQRQSAMSDLAVKGGRPVSDFFAQSDDLLLECVLTTFPELRRRL
ncbi:hypothetical protein TUMSATVNIG1_56860 (plasmid) [Vibrio nigripulchritudo]|uniref:DUF1611 domain-containing protein n=1 Tax=Vibrio nigripulchritudo TaxID=28173 RepID=UPI00190CC528|nr:DUF1611 domain-containing protein [Vibrio nigripulchritudo]BCL73703.1 hypothetical protein VNTUMSATTG_56400 [Vibrio nigripulchritudo]BDU35077.1 hypothetical protein TUMSATVNIG1_56860 [Vibrio nigripulchritudo]